MNHTPYRTASHLAAFSLLVCLSTVSILTPVRAAKDPESQETLNGGYYLLHKVCEDETNLPLLIMVKHTPQDITDYMNRIAKTAKESAGDIERLHESDASLQFERNPLPLIECDVRESIHDDKQHQLLFGTTNSEFVRALLVSQIESSTYALNLAKVLAEQEKDQDRVKTLQHMSAKWLTIRNEAFRLLRN